MELDQYIEVLTLIFAMPCNCKFKYFIFWVLCMLFINFYQNWLDKVLNQQGIISACPDLESVLPLPSHTSCALSASCSGVTCCTDIALLATSVQTEVSVERCRGKVYIRLEKLEIVIMLNDFEYSSWQTYTIQNVFRLE